MLTLITMLTIACAPHSTIGSPVTQSAALIHRGAPFTLTKAVTLDQVMATPEKYSIRRRLELTVRSKSVCTKKGCWLILAGSAPTSRVRVTFKDYAFFAPMDSAGYSASVEGVVQAKVLSDAERAHLAEDAKLPVESVPKAELRIVASAASFPKALNKLSQSGYTISDTDSRSFIINTMVSGSVLGDLSLYYSLLHYIRF